MYILTNANQENENAIMFISETIARQEGTDYYLVNNDSVAIPPQFIKGVFEVEEIPEGVESEKYCYTEADGFYKNPNYVEPPASTEELIAELQVAVAELGEIIAGGVE